MKDLVFFTSPIGLGHATRDVAIAHHLEGISKKFVSGAGAFRLLAEYGLDADNLYSPPPFRVENGKLQKPLRWLFRYLSYYNECKKISAKVIDKERPSLVVSDEDFASLVTAQEQRIRTVVVTDILQSRFASGLGSIIEKRMSRGMKNIIEKCDLVVIPENGQSSGKTARVGPIVRDVAESRDQLRKKYSFDRKTVVVSIGGTDIGRFLIEKTVEVFKKSEIDADLVIVSGPTLKMEQAPYRNLGFVQNLHEMIFAADLVISLAGKSTIDESRHFGTPGIFIPIKGHFEQEENARDEGYSFEDIFRLEKLVLEKIDEKRDPRPFDGARIAAEMIKKLL
ncbi:MAG: UDP-glucuronosyltransferase [Thaumarchaeota archaeon]|nr:UDP-glucuronosyltransferase [Nitrososphaerota archaeon]